MKKMNCLKKMLFKPKRFFCTSNRIFEGERNDVLYLRDNALKKDFFFIGTMSAAEKSTKEIINLIDKINPDTLFIGTDPSKVDDVIHLNRIKRKEISSFFSIRSIRHFMLSRYKKGPVERMDRLIGMEQGINYEVIIKEADKRKLEVVFGDIPSQIITEKLVKLDLEKLVHDIYETLPGYITDGPELVLRYFDAVNIDKALDNDVELRKLIKDFPRIFKIISPEFYEVIIKERDEHFARVVKGCLGDIIVCIVGSHHLEGIERNWKENMSIKEILD